MQELLKKRQFKKIEKILLEQLRNNRSDIDILMKLAMVRLQFPFEDEDTAISYLNEILKIEEFHFQALVIKMYLQNFYYCNMDKDLEKILNFTWKDSYQISIAEYIYSWKFHQIYNINVHEREKEMEWLKKSIEVYPYMVYPYVKLARMHVEMNHLNEARQCYLNAISHVESVKFTDEDAISPQAFIDEYITGIRLSSLNFESLKEESKKV